MTQHTFHNEADSRAQRTQQALFEAFTTLVLQRPYDDIRIADIIQQAGIARSTFYQHYRNKDDILVNSMHGMLVVLADAATGRGRHGAVQHILEHFWENRQLGRIILNSPAYRRITTELAQIIEARWQETPPPASGIPARLLSIQLAEGQFSVIRTWLSGTIGCRVDALATHLLGTPAGAM